MRASELEGRGVLGALGWEVGGSVRLFILHLCLDTRVWVAVMAGSWVSFIPSTYTHRMLTLLQ